MSVGWAGWVIGGVALLLVAGLWGYGRRQLLERAVPTDKCPRCGQDKWHRIHRSLPDYFFGVGLKLRRFQCANEACHWEGLRRRVNG